MLDISQDNGHSQERLEWRMGRNEQETDTR